MRILVKVLGIYWRLIQNKSFDFQVYASNCLKMKHCLPNDLNAFELLLIKGYLQRTEEFIMQWGPFS